MLFDDELLSQLAKQAIAAARAAGRLIDANRQTGIDVRRKETGTSAASQIVTEVDHKAQAAILEILKPTCSVHDLALLTEEAPDNGQRREKPAFWSIDPMDGTLAFIRNTPGFSVSIALVARDGTPLIGVVHDPLEQDLFHAVRGQGAFKNGQRIRVPGLDPEKPLLLRTDLSFQSDPLLEQTAAGLEEIASNLGLPGADIRFQVGAVMNACGILESPNTCYFKYPRTGNSGGSLWDYAATACLFDEVGAVASDIEGRPMELNRAGSTFMNHRGILYAGHRELADRIIEMHRRLADR